MTTTTADTYLAERIAEQERYVFGLEAMDADLRDGAASWRDWNPDFTCPDRQEAAIDECGSALDDARRELAKLQTALGSAEIGD